MTNSRPNIATTALGLGVVGSLSFNIAWAWPSPVLTGVGVLMAFTLPTAVLLWRASGHVTGWARFERAAVMSFIAVGAGSYTAVHAALLLRDAGLPIAIAWLPALVGEALVVMAARAGAPVPPSRAKPAPKVPAKRDTAPPPKTKRAPKKSAGDDEEQVTVDGVTFWAVRIPDDASDAERDRIGATNRTRKARAKKAQTNGVHA